MNSQRQKDEFYLVKTGKEITLARVYCVLQTRGYAVAIQRLTSQSERAEMDIPVGLVYANAGYPKLEWPIRALEKLYSLAS